jgi:glucan phosphoethanolaminetransferase (alkaline phosphatase superfamily)
MQRIYTDLEDIMKKFSNFTDTLFRKNYSEFILLFIFTLCYSLLFNAIDFIRYPVKSGNAISTILLFVLSIFLVYYFFLLASINKILFNATVIITTFISSITLYYIILYKIRVYLLDTFILLIQTNVHEAIGVISIDLIVFTCIITLFSIAFLYLYNKKLTCSSLKNKFIVIILLTPLLFSLYFSRPVMPYSFFYAVKMYKQYVNIINQPKTDISQFPSTFDEKKNKDLIVIFIIGEAARADHFSINGYKRTTSPLIEQLQVISLPNINSFFGVTNQAVPLMLTRATNKSFEIANKETSFISIFNKHGFTTAWISNQDIIDNSYSNISSFANEAQILKQVIWNVSSKKDYSIINSKILDENMLPSVDHLLTLPNRKLIVMHCMGSHWEFHKHYPDSFLKFTPPCTVRNVSRCKQDELINSYDNSILYVDYIISEVIKRLLNKNAIVIYCSDHGEFLGEDGYYGHIPGISRKEITNPAMFVWMSSIYKKKNPEKYLNLIKNKDKNLPNYVLFHSILDAASIDGTVVNKNLSIFSKMKINND